jgi:N-methylhydantoinase B
VIVHRRAIAPDTGGPGRYRGGCGQEMEVGVRTAAPYNLGPVFDRVRVPAEGYAGGGAGGRGAVRLSDGRELADKSQILLPPEVRFTLCLPGGGGFHDPDTRDPAAVLDDVLDEFVSLAAAREQYGVVINPATMQVDEAATAALRRERARK